MPQLTLTLDKNSYDALMQYAVTTNKTAEAIAENIIDLAMVHFLSGVSNGIDRAVDVMKESTPPAITSESQTLENQQKKAQQSFGGHSSHTGQSEALETEARKISDVYKF